MEDATLYNQITVKNIDDEDFIFSVNREKYVINAGETRIFPKFMVRPMLKHLIDKILIKRDPEGKLLRNQQLRDELAGQIVLGEEVYQKPVVPTDRELVEKMNTQPELDRILERNKKAQKGEDTTLIEKPEVNTAKITTPKPGKIKEIKEPKVIEQVSQPVDATLMSAPAPTTPTETFDQIEDEQHPQIPPREEMLKYAKETLKLDVDEPKTKKAWDAMSDEDLFVELNLDKEGDLKELGFK